MTHSEWQDGSPEQVFVIGFDRYIEDIYAVLYALAQSYAPRIEAWMKQNAVWVDRTGNARQALFTDVEWIVGDAIYLYAAQGMDYGTYLELNHQGRFAIILPALEHFAPMIWRDVQELFA